MTYLGGCLRPAVDCNRLLMMMMLEQVGIYASILSVFIIKLGILEYLTVTSALLVIDKTDRMVITNNSLKLGVCESRRCQFDARILVKYRLVPSTQTLGN